MLNSLTVILPIFNEEKSIESTLANIRTEIALHKLPVRQIIAINDGSTDRTREILDKCPDIQVIHHELNRGYGASLKTGLELCTSEAALILDADGTYPVKMISELFKKMDDSTMMAVGARYGTGISRHPFKRVARYVLKKLVHGLTGVRVPDLNSGMRIFRVSLFREFVHLLPNGFSFTTTITVASLYRGYPVAFVPIVYNKRVGTSSIHPLRDFLAFSILIIRLATYFDPLRFYLPISYFLTFTGILRGIRDVYVTNSLGSLSVVLVLFAFQIFAIGCLADLIIRRGQAQNYRNNRPKSPDLI